MKAREFGTMLTTVGVIAAAILFVRGKVKIVPKDQSDELVKEKAEEGFSGFDGAPDENKIAQLSKRVAYLQYKIRRVRKGSQTWVALSKKLSASVASLWKLLLGAIKYYERASAKILSKGRLAVGSPDAIRYMDYQKKVALYKRMLSQLPVVLPQRPKPTMARAKGIQAGW